LATTVAKVAATAVVMARVVVTKLVHPLLGRLMDHLVGRHLVGHLVGRHLVGRHLVGFHQAKVVAKVVVVAVPHPKEQWA
jgi:hypothetical protein